MNFSDFSPSELEEIKIALIDKLQSVRNTARALRDIDTSQSVNLALDMDVRASVLQDIVRRIDRHLSA